MTIIRKVVPLQVEQLADNRTRVTAATNQLARDGHVVEPAGLQTENFLRCGTILFDHDSKMPVAKPVAATVSPDGTSLSVDLEWAPPEICDQADRIRGLVKAGIIRAVSIGFDPIDMEPLDAKKPRGGQHITTAELLELSFAPVPADTGAVVTQRSDQEQTPMPEPRTPTVSKTHAKLTRALERAPKTPVLKRGLYEVASLAYVLESLGYAVSVAEWEADLEGDGSEVPAMLVEALQAAAKAFLAMAPEEVAELLARFAEDDEAAETIEHGLSDTERKFIGRGKTPQCRAWRRGVALARAGRALSSANEKLLDQASDHCDRAMKHHKALGDNNQGVADQVEACRSLNGKAAKATSDASQAVADAQAEPEKAPAHLKRAAKALKGAQGNLEDLTTAHSDAADRCQDVGDSHNGIGRSIKSAQRCMRSVVEGSTGANDDEDNKAVQKSGGTGEDDGTASERSADADRRRRQRDLLELCGVEH